MKNEQNAKVTKVEQLKIERQKAREEILRLLGDSRQIFAIVRKVAASGMSRKIDFYCFQKDEKYGFQKFYLNYDMSILCGFNRDKKGELIFRGYGTDFAEDAIQSLSYALFKDSHVLRKESI